MERFAYKAKTRDGQNRQGQVEARDMSAAVGVLRERGMVVVTIRAVHDAHGMAVIMKPFQKVKLDDIVAFTRQFSTMISSGLALTEALNILEIQSKPALAKVISEVLREVQAGASLSEALEKHDNVFSGVYISLIKAGEASGSLDEVLKRLADNMERDKEFKAKIKGAMIYPVIVVIGMFLVGAIMMIFVVPKLAEMYTEFDADLPLATKSLIIISTIFQKFWIVALILGGIGGWFFLRWKATVSGKRQFDKMMLSAPVFGKISSQVTLAEMSRTMSLLMAAGISLLEALEIVSGVLTNQVYEDALEANIKSVKKGIPLSIAMSRSAIFPPLMSNMIAVGEETGKMDEVLMKVADYYQIESEHAVRNLTTALEPLIMIVLGVGVAFLVMAIIMPIYNLTNQF